jgi:hypothetical protein
MTIIGVVGKIGSGKSLSQLREGLYYADKREKQLVTNFLINEKELYKYACLPKFSDQFWGKVLIEAIHFKYAIQWHLSTIFPFIKKPKKIKFKPRLPWIKHLIENNMGIIQIPNPSNFQALMIPRSVILLDEAGIFFNAREFSKTPKELLADLNQSRKFGCDLIWCAQFDKQIDVQMRMVTQYIWHCCGVTIPWDKKLKGPRLIFKTMHIFDTENYEMWVNNPRARSSWIKTRFAYATRTDEGPITLADQQLFKCFDSFERLDVANNRSAFKISTIHQCTLKGRFIENRLRSIKEWRMIRIYLICIVWIYEDVLTMETWRELRNELREGAAFVQVLSPESAMIFNSTNNQSN